MNKLFCGMLGALALCAVTASAQAAPRPEARALLAPALATSAVSAPVSIAVFRPGETVGEVQTVQYRRHYRRHYRHRRGRRY